MRRKLCQKFSVEKVNKLFIKLHQVLDMCLSYAQNLNNQKDDLYIQVFFLSKFNKSILLAAVQAVQCFTMREQEID